jgi:protein-S-isoprenylcysteine O-methyltransferase Ste14
MLRKLDLPPVWFLLSIVCIWIGKITIPVMHIPFGKVGSGGITCAGLALGIWATIWFYRKRTPIEPFHTPKAFIVEGPYRLSRNPIYLAMVSFSAAATLWTGSVVGIVTTPLLWLILDRRFVRQEERVLHATFGGQAEVFFRATRRWL